MHCLWKGVLICCGCSNMTSNDDVISANNMDLVVLLQNNKKVKKQSLFSERI